MKQLVPFAVGVLLVALQAPHAVAQSKMTLTADRPSYRIGQTPMLTVTGVPGRRIYFIVGDKRKEVMIPGIGTLCVDPWAITSALIIVGRMPAKGSLTFPCTVPCNKLFAEATAYLQAVELDTITGDASVSNCLELNTVGGDCKGKCLGKVTVLGLQTCFTNGKSGKQDLRICAGIKDSGDSTYAKLSIEIDWSKPPSLPIYNKSESIKITHLSRDGKKVCVRFEIDAIEAGHKYFPWSLWVSARLDKCCKSRCIKTNCKSGIDVGDVLGPFVVTKFISVK